MLQSFKGRSTTEGPLLFIVLLFGLSLSLFWACEGSNSAKLSPKEYDQQTLLSVDDIEVSVFEFNEAYIAHLIRSGQNDTKETRYRFLNRWIDNIVLAKKALDTGYSTKPEYQEAVASQKRKSVADMMFMESMNDSLPKLTDEEMRLAFAKSKRKVYVRQLYATTEEALIPWYDSLLAGADFIQIANQFYETPEYDSLAGYLGSIGYYSVDDRFAETAFSLNKGEFSAPLRSKLGWHIVWVEHLIMEAMLAEDEYQIRKKRTATQIGTRKANLFATDFIMRRMQALNVKPSREGILGLREVLQNYAFTDEEIQQQEYTNHPEFWQEAQLDAIDDDLVPDMVLAEFEYDGEKQRFTIADYLKWLPYLPAAESSARTGASVGRALRNQYFYQEGLKSGVDEQFEVKRIVRNRGLDVLSQLYQRDIIQSAVQSSNSIITPTWFVQQMYPVQSYSMQVDGWYIKVDNAEEGKKRRDELKRTDKGKPTNAIAFDRSKRIDRSNPLFSLISKAILGEPMLANSKNEGWIILNVNQRSFLAESERTDIQIDSTLISQQYAAYKALNDSISYFREGYKIKVDSALFNEIYTLEEVKNN